MKHLKHLDISNKTFKTPKLKKFQKSTAHLEAQFASDWLDLSLTRSLLNNRLKVF